MAEWWTYSLSDFLMFAPRTYYRLFELMNEALWPAHIVAVVVGGVILTLARLGGAGAGRAAAGLLALAWLTVAWAFFLERYATINWAAEYMAWGFAFQALLLLAAAAPGRALAFRAERSAIQSLARGLILAAVFLYPLIAPAMGRAWRQAEFFGIAPDPTAVAALGLALLFPLRAMWLLLPLPLLWCAIGGATLWTMKAPDAAVLPAVAMLALVLAVAKTRSRRAQTRGAALTARTASVIDGRTP